MSDNLSPVRAVVWFVALAYAGMWLAMSPLLLDGFSRSSNDVGMSTLVTVCVNLAMLTPAVAALVVMRFIEKRRGIRAGLGLRMPRPVSRAAGECLLALAVPFAIIIAALALGAVAGVYTIDLSDLSGFRDQFAPETVGSPGIPWGAVAGWVVTLLGTMAISLPLFFGEELGWQGYLFPRLGRWGMPRALLLTSVIFALWHLPTLLMGGQYPGYPWWLAVPAFVFSAALGVPIFTWLRLRTSWVVPAVLAHTVVSSANSALAWFFASADVPPDPMHAGLFGWPGWIVMGGFVVVLIATGRLSATVDEPVVEPRRA